MSRTTFGDPALHTGYANHLEYFTSCSAHVAPHLKPLAPEPQYPPTHCEDPAPHPEYSAHHLEYVEFKMNIPRLILNIARDSCLRAAQRLFEYLTMCCSGRFQDFVGTCSGLCRELFNTWCSLLVQDFLNNCSAIAQDTVS